MKADDRQYLEALRAFWKEHQTFPSMAKLCGVVGLSSTSSVFALVRRLVESGYLERVSGRIAPTKAFFGRPVLGQVRAGVPQSAGQDVPELLSIDDHLVANPSRTFLCRVRGDSMKDVGLLDGDLVVVERNAPAAPGDIVVAVVDGEFTVKTLRHSHAKGQFYLQAANQAYADIVPKGSLELAGVVRGSFRRYGS